MKKKVKKLLIFVLVLLSILTILRIKNGSGKNTTIDGEENKEFSTFFGDDWRELAISKDAWFYIDGCLLKYYDTSDHRSYVLCSKPNCLHISESCDAYFSPSFQEGFNDSSAIGVTRYGKYLYVWCKNTPNVFEGNFELIRIDPSDGTRTVIASFPDAETVGGHVGEDIVLLSVDEVMTAINCCGYLWFPYTHFVIPETKFNEGDSISWTQAMGIELATGRQILIGDRDDQCSIDTCWADKIVYHKDVREQKMLSDKEFYELMQNNQVTIEDKTFSDYMEYVSWFRNTVPFETFIYLYDAGTDKNTLLFKTSSVIGHNDNEAVMMSVNKVVGAYKGKIVVAEYVPDSENNYSYNHFVLSAYDPETNTTSFIDEIERGSWLIMANHVEGMTYVMPDGWLYYFKIPDENKKVKWNNGDRDVYGLEIDMWGYNMETGEKRYCFSDTTRINFRLYGMWNDGYLGKIAGDAENYFNYVWISRDDYLNGRFEKIVHYDVSK